MRRILLSFLATGLSLPWVVAAQDSFGPLYSVEASPLQRVGFSHSVEGANLLAPGAVRAESWTGYSNIFEQDSSATHELFIDLERLSTAVGVRWGAASRLEVGGRLSFETTGAGVLDGFVRAWHVRLGLPSGNRKHYPVGVYAQRLTDSTGSVRFDLPKRTLALEDVRLFAKWRAWENSDGRRLLSLSATARFPTVDNGVGPRRADLALAALGRASWIRWLLHAGVGVATVRAARDFDGLVRPGAFFADVGVERVLRANLSGVAQVSLESPRLQGFGYPELDGWPINLVLGLTGKVGDRWRMDLSFQEDIPSRSPATDFTLGVGVRRDW